MLFDAVVTAPLEAYWTSLALNKSEYAVGFFLSSLHPFSFSFFLSSFLSLLSVVSLAFFFKFISSPVHFFRSCTPLFISYLLYLLLIGCSSLATQPLCTFSRPLHRITITHHCTLFLFFYLHFYHVPSGHGAGHFIACRSVWDRLMRCTLAGAAWPYIMLRLWNAEGKPWLEASQVWRHYLCVAWQELRQGGGDCLPGHAERPIADQLVCGARSAEQSVSRGLVG